MQNLISNIVAHLDNVSALRYKDENWGQLQYYGKDCPVQWPCALVDLAGGQFSNIGANWRETPENLQEGTLNIEIIVADIRLSNTSGRAPMSQKIGGRKIWETVEAVHAALQGFRPLDDSGGLVRTSISSIKRDDGVQEKHITYSVGLHGC